MLPGPSSCFDLAKKPGMAERGRAYVREHHDWDLLGERLADLPTDLIEKPPKG